MKKKLLVFICLLSPCFTTSPISNAATAEFEEPIVTKTDMENILAVIYRLGHEINVYAVAPIINPAKDFFNTVAKCKRNICTVLANLQETVLPTDPEKSKKNRIKIMRLEEDLKRYKDALVKLEKQLIYYAPSNDMSRLENLLIDRHATIAAYETAKENLTLAQKNLKNTMAIIATTEPSHRALWQTSLITGGALTCGGAVGYLLYKFILNPLFKIKPKLLEKTTQKLKKAKNEYEKTKNNVDKAKQLLQENLKNEDPKNETLAKKLSAAKEYIEKMVPALKKDAEAIRLLERKVFNLKIRKFIQSVGSPVIAILGAFASAYGLYKLGDMACPSSHPAQRMVSDQEKSNLYNTAAREKELVRNCESDYQYQKKSFSQLGRLPSDIMEQYDRYQNLQKKIKQTEEQINELKTHRQALVNAGIAVIENV